MTSFRFLHAADLHLDSPLRGLEADAPATRIREATRQALVKLVALALAEEVAFVLLAGDLYDGDWEDWPTGQFLITQIGKLTRAGIPVYAIRGNHDAQSVLTRDLRWPDGAHLFDSTAAHTLIVPGMDVAIHGRSFPHRAVKDEAFMRGYPDPVPGMLNIGLLHTACSNAGPHENYAPCTIEQLTGHGYDYWALGHVHHRAELHGHPSWVVFPGNVQGRHINEAGPKGATLVQVDGRRLTPEHRNLDVVRWAWIEVDLAGALDQDAVSARIQSALLRAVEEADGVWLAARVLLLGATVTHAALTRDPGATREAVRAEVGGLGLASQLWVQRVTVMTQPALDLATLREGDDAMATLLRALDQPPTPALLSAVALYAGQMLDRAPKLRDALGVDHPAVLAQAGALPAELIDRARALLLARIVEG